MEMPRSSEVNDCSPRPMKIAESCIKSQRSMGATQSRKDETSVGRRRRLPHLAAVAFHQGYAGEDYQHREQLADADLFPVEHPAEKHRDHRVDVVISADYRYRKFIQHVKIGTVADHRAECHQVKHGRDAARGPLYRLRLGEKRGSQKNKAGGQLLYRAADYWMRFGNVPTLQDGAKGPPATTELQHQEALQQRPAPTLLNRVRRNQQRDR